jgi:hypothetical protein
MELLTTAAVTGELASDFAVGKLLNTLSGKVVGYWSDYRAKQFAAAFISAVAADDSAAVQKRIDAFAKDPRKSAALFDAYRRVALSASPTLGPRIIALVMAQVVVENRQPTEDGERILAAARELTDAELIAARDGWWDGVNKFRPSSRGSTFLYKAGQPIEYYKYEGGGDEGHHYWFDEGSWAGKLSAIGFVWSQQRVELDQRNEPKIVTDLYRSNAYSLLADLVTQAEELGQDESSAT